MSIRDDVNKLYRAGAKRIVLDEIAQRPAIPAKTGVGEYQAPTNGGSVASPITESEKEGVVPAVPDRTYYPERTLTSTDGLLTFKVKDIQTMRSTDASANPFVQVFADPKNE